MSPALLPVFFVCLCAMSATGQACDFENEVDMYTEYYNLVGDWSAYTSEDCKALCCADATCTVWQFAAFPGGHQAQCNTGDSDSYGDSNGIQYVGEQGRGGSDAAGGGGGGSKHKCVGVHCDDSEWATMFVVGAAVLGGLYLTIGVGFAVKVGKTGQDIIPNVLFWKNLGGLVVDGVTFTICKSSGKERTGLSSLGSSLIDPAAAAAGGGGVGSGPLVSHIVGDVESGADPLAAPAAGHTAALTSNAATHSTSSPRKSRPRDKSTCKVSTPRSRDSQGAKVRKKKPRPKGKPKGGHEPGRATGGSAASLE